MPGELECAVSMSLNTSDGSAKGLCFVLTEVIHPLSPLAYQMVMTMSQ